MRDAFSVDWFDYDLSAGLTFPGFVAGGADYDNGGGAAAGNFVDINFGATVQFGALGFAATGDINRFEQASLASATDGDSLSMSIGRWKALAAYGFFGGQLSVGGGLRALTMQIDDNANGKTLLTMTGAAPEVGALFMPTGFQGRVGATVRAPVSGGIFGSDGVTKDGDLKKVGRFVLPSRVVEPWEIEAGIAYQLGPRPLNPGWENPRDQERWLRTRIAEDRAERARLQDEELAHLPPDDRAVRAAAIAADEAKEQAEEDARFETERKRLRDVRKARYANWPREKILLLASVTMTGASYNAVSIAGFLDQKWKYVGQSVDVTPRLGMEGEPLRDRLELRVGTYVEPSRYQSGTPRQHFTFGGDVRLLPFGFWVLPAVNWKLTFMVDLAPRYTNYGIGIGNWH